MKKFAIAFLMLLLTMSAGAQNRFGVTVGTTTSHLRGGEAMYGKNSTQDHIGFTYQRDIVWGFVVQPSLLYQVKSAKTSGTSDYLSLRYLELPVGLQWGPDLLVFRPYFELTPFIGYALSGKIRPDGGSSQTFTPSKDSRYNPFEYGVGVGGGIEFWHIQLSGHYFWNHEDCLRDTDRRFGTATFSLAFLF